MLVTCMPVPSSVLSPEQRPHGRPAQVQVGWSHCTAVGCRWITS